jgi:hypothetical protein
MLRRDVVTASQPARRGSSYFRTTGVMLMRTIKGCATGRAHCGADGRLSARRSYRLRPSCSRSQMRGRHCPVTRSGSSTTVGAAACLLRVSRGRDEIAHDGHCYLGKTEASAGKSGKLQNCRAQPKAVGIVLQKSVRLEALEAPVRRAARGAEIVGDLCCSDDSAAFTSISCTDIHDVCPEYRDW